MVTETAQLLCSAFDNGQAPYRRTHFNHPSAIWTRYSKENFLWLCAHGDALAKEYTFRYGKVHKSSIAISWCKDNLNLISFSSKDFTLQPQCMPDQYKVENNPVQAYQNYYIGEKSAFAKWPSIRVPSWWTKPVLL